MLKMFEFLTSVLESSEAREGFILTYDFRSTICPHGDVITDLVSWTLEPNRRARWQAQCIGWRVVVPSVMYYSFKILLSSVFFLYPPSCAVYLVTDSAQALDETTVCYQPSEAIMAAPILRSPVHDRTEEGPADAQGHVGEAKESKSVEPLPPVTNLGFLCGTSTALPHPVDANL